MSTTTIPGYTSGSPSLAHSPVSLADFQTMKASVLFGDDDITALKQSGPILEGQIDAVLDVWYGFVGANGHLLRTFMGPDGNPDGDYLAAVRKRFGQWILDTARADYGQHWLDYQHEIGLRHHRTKKNQTDGARAAAIVPFRDLALLVFPITHTLKPFLAGHGHSAEEVERMHTAWVKSCLLQVTLWSYPYVQEGDF